MEDKEQRLEKKIDRQAAKIEAGDRGVDMEGLDKKHRVMLRVMSLNFNSPPPTFRTKKT